MQKSSDFLGINTPRNLLVALFDRAKCQLTKEELNWVAEFSYSLGAQTEYLSSFFEEFSCAVQQDGEIANQELVSTLCRSLSTQLSLLAGLAEITLMAKQVPYVD